MRTSSTSLFIISLIMGVAGFIFGACAGIEHTKKQAAENNSAHYEVDSKTGYTTFVWDGKKE